MAARPWTKEQRKAQADAIRRWRPWQRSSGPRTRRGKRVSSLNALKHALSGKAVKVFRRLDRRYKRKAVPDMALLERVEKARVRAVQSLASRIQFVRSPDDQLRVLLFVARMERDGTRRALPSHWARRLLDYELSQEKEGEETKQNETG